MIADEHPALAVVVARNPVRRREHFVHRRVEPAVHVRADQLAADDEHEDRRNEGHPQEQQHELGAEPRERQRLAPLDNQLDDVARQDEQERREHREVRGRQRVQDELAEEVGREARTARDDDERHERRDEHGDARENQPRVVAERPTGRVLASARNRRRS